LPTLPIHVFVMKFEGEYNMFHFSTSMLASRKKQARALRHITCTAYLFMLDFLKR
jgi:hypothetical protein